MAAERFDAIIVGLGAAGAVVTEALSAAGWKILALEEGPWYNPFKDFAGGRARRIPTGIQYDRGVSGRVLCRPLVAARFSTPVWSTVIQKALSKELRAIS